MEITHYLFVVFIIHIAAQEISPLLIASTDEITNDTKINSLEDHTNGTEKLYRRKRQIGYGLPGGPYDRRRYPLPPVFGGIGFGGIGYGRGYGNRGFGGRGFGGRGSGGRGFGGRGIGGRGIGGRGIGGRGGGIGGGRGGGGGRG